MRPSTCCSVNTGISAAMMISIAKSVGRATSIADADDEAQHLAPRSAAARAAARACTFSTSTTAPSTRMPKSIAPIEIRLAGSSMHVQADERAEQRERDHRRDDQRAGEAAQEQPHHRHHQQEAVQQVVLHRAERVADEERAVVERLDLHALAAGSCRSARATFCVHAVQHARRVLAAAHEHEALDRLLLLVPADGAAPRRVRHARSRRRRRP